jgi:hypothetical protein
MAGAVALLLGLGECATAGAQAPEKLDGISQAGFPRGGIYSFPRTARNLANIINHRTIFAAGAFSTPGVLSRETTTARLGTLHLAAGNLLTLGLSGNGLIHFAVDATTVPQALGPDGQPFASRVGNEGAIAADGKEVTLTAKVVSEVLTRVVNNNGIVVARSLVTYGGVARLIGGDETPEVATALAAR